jgi:hypothetical protein
MRREAAQLPDLKSEKHRQAMVFGGAISWEFWIFKG